MNQSAPLRPLSIPAAAKAARLLPGLLLVAGCKVGPDYVVPEVDLPDEWHHAAMSGV